MCAQALSERDGHTEAIQVEWDPSETSYDKMLSTFLSCYSGGTLLHVQYKCAIWWHNEVQREKAMALKRKVTIAWVVMMVIVVALCVTLVVTVGSSAHRFWFLSGIPLVGFFMPGQLDVLPVCPWHDAEAYHQKYLQKNPSR